MIRRRGSLGWVVSGLGLLLSVCLLPYLISSVYSLASTMLQVPAATQWLWGDWLSTVVDPGRLEYRLAVEAPVCCAGAVGLLITIFGIVWLVAGGEGDEPDKEEETYDSEVSEEECTAEVAEEAGAVEPRTGQVEPDVDRATW